MPAPGKGRAGEGDSRYGLEDDGLLEDDELNVDPSFLSDLDEPPQAGVGEPLPAGALVLPLLLGSDEGAPEPRNHAPDPRGHPNVALEDREEPLAGASAGVAEGQVKVVAGHGEGGPAGPGEAIAFQGLGQSPASREREVAPPIEPESQAQPHSREVDKPRSGPIQARTATETTVKAIVEAAREDTRPRVEPVAGPLPVPEAEPLAELPASPAAPNPGEPSEERQLQQPLPQQPRTGFVLVDVAMRRHPLWSELSSLDQEMDACRADWQRQVDAYRITEADIAECYEAGARVVLGRAANGGQIERASETIYADALARELAEIESRLEEEAADRVEAKAAETRTQLEDRLYAERARLNQELDTFKDSAFREYFLSLFNIELRSRLLKLPEEEQRQLEEKRAGLIREMEARIAAKQEEVEAAFAAYSEREKAAAEANIEGFRDQQERFVAEEIRKERARLERGLAARILAMESSLPADGEKWREEVARRAMIVLSTRRERLSREFAAREAAFVETWESLKARRDALHARILEDIRRAAREIEGTRGMSVTIVESSAPGQEMPAGQDLTEQALQVIRDR